MLKEAIDSVLAQTYKDAELIVVDDGSTDNTPDILEEYGAQSLSGFGIPVTSIRQPNRGVSAARNAGILKASGELIAFLDSDDLWLPEKLAVQTAFFQSRPDALICQTEELWFRNGVRVNPKKKHKKSSGRIFSRSLELCLVSPSAVMIRRCLFDEIGLFDETLPACEDYDLWLKISSRYPVDLIETPLIVKRGGHEDQLSKEPGLDRYRIRAIHNLLNTGRLSGQQRLDAVNVLKDKCAIYAQGCMKRGKKEEAGGYLKLADKYSILT